MKVISVLGGSPVGRGSDNDNDDYGDGSYYAVDDCCSGDGSDVENDGCHVDNYDYGNVIGVCCGIVVVACFVFVVLVSCFLFCFFGRPKHVRLLAF